MLKDALSFARGPSRAGKDTMAFAEWLGTTVADPLKNTSDIVALGGRDSGAPEYPSPVNSTVLENLIRQKHRYKTAEMPMTDFCKV